MSVDEDNVMITWAVPREEPVVELPAQFAWGSSEISLGPVDYDDAWFALAQAVTTLITTLAGILVTRGYAVSGVSVPDDPYPPSLVIVAGDDT
ncbi:hypothetical protein ACIQNU_01150 [Streptomyces sp. NPDC091292]|uniref:hypothetical protein n=1 Tax=Streptomyces sp. NPDC091292 TaxID=3365991 RepID=UPI0037F4F67D